MQILLAQFIVKNEGGAALKQIEVEILTPQIKDVLTWKITFLDSHVRKFYGVV